MQQRRRHNQNKGFTLTEALIAVAVTIVLLAVSFIGVSQVRSRLKITELDNAAREIYLAAQNRAVLLSNRGALTQLVVKTDNALDQPDGAVYYYIDSNDTTTLDQLLPKGTIDPVLTDGRFYIIFEPNSASVTDVFFLEDKDQDLPGGVGIDTYYFDVNTRLRETRRTSDPMVGWYGGDPSEAGNAIVLRSPQLIIHNEDVLWVEVRWWVPTMLATLNNDIELSLQLEYGGETVDLTTSGRQLGTDTPKISSSNFVHSTAYVLDSLVKGQQFSDFTEITSTLGGDFTVTATVSLRSGTKVPGGLQVSPGTYKASDNSLFARETGDGTTAYIQYMRHLQNLEPSFSSVRDTITAAVQTADIDNPSVPSQYKDSAAETGSDYVFTPINNANLTSYDGRKFEIRGLLVDEHTDNAGLFGTFGSSTASPRSTLTDVRLMNAQVSNTNTGTGTYIYAGALAAQIKNAAVTGCQVYWKKTDATQADLTALLGTADKDNYNITDKDYMVTGPIAGGLFGHAVDVTIDHSSASTTVQGANQTGGLVGEGERLNVTGSYADCYLAGPHVAGLVGDLTGAGSSFEHVYSAGFINLDNSADAPHAYGLFKGSASVSNSYAAMAYGGEADLTGTKNNITAVGDNSTLSDNVYYLEYLETSSGTGTPNLAKSLTSSELKTLAETGSSGTNKLEGFLTKQAAYTHAYDLQEEMALDRYPYPGLEGLDHYGDWPDKLRIRSLVYWEQYTTKAGDGSDIGIYGGNIRTLRNGENTMVKDDGYAIVLDQSQFDAAAAGTITIRYTAKLLDAGTTITAEGTYTLTNRDNLAEFTVQAANRTAETYYLAKLPRTLINPSANVVASNSFYWELEVTMSDGSSEGTHLFYYNPHFASTAMEAVGDVAPTPPDLNTGIAVRSARHFYSLSQYRSYFNSTNTYTFLQQLDIDYNLYTGTFTTAEDGSDTLKSQPPIGVSVSAPFSEVYNGAYHTVQNVPLRDGGYDHVGLFGYNTGSINNLFYLGGAYLGGSYTQANENHLSLTVSVSGSGSTKYVGQFCGFNRGSIFNCAVSHVELELTAHSYASLYAGGMVGLNEGLINDCSAVTDDLDLQSTNANAWLGGFVGSNGGGGAIDSCYAVGTLNGAKSGISSGTDSSGLLYLAGFAAGSQGLIRSSYAATALTLSNGRNINGFCPDVDKVSNCYFLDKGNFDFYHPTRSDDSEYTDYPRSFSAQYASGADAALGKTWSFFTSTDKTDKTSSLLANLGGGFVCTADDNYDLPKIVQVSSTAGDKRHFGVYIKPLELKSMGVFYWENEVGGNDGLHISAMILDGTDTINYILTAREISTLCTAHADGGVIDKYGYGYFYPANLEFGRDFIFTPTNFSGTRIESDNTGSLDNIANQVKALMNLGDADYTFVAYQTAQAPFDPGEKPDTHVEKGAMDSTWVFSIPATSVFVTFYVNPFFADSFALESVPWIPKYENLTHRGTLGKPETVGDYYVPYGVRTLAQLQFINWNETDQNTNTALESTAASAAQFPYLNRNGNTDPLHWVQSHDLLSVADPSKAGTSGHTADGRYIYTPIAAFDAQNNATAYGWFGGSYEGGGYTIQELNITSGAATVGLFGLTYNAHLQDIVLYSPSGTAAVTRSTSVNSWYALGGLVGLAATSDNGSKIQNCSIAGYQIVDETTSGDSGNGGAGVGGLLGICNMALSHCAAVTDISLNFTYNQDSRNVRVGGVAGSCQQSISYCYSGGSIKNNFTTGQDNTHLHVGGIAGGIYMKALTIGGKPIENRPNGNTFEYCYTYTKLPDNLFLKCGNVGHYTIGGSNNHDHLYAIGGIGELMHSPTAGKQTNIYDYRGPSSSYNNCYYLYDTTIGRTIEISSLADPLKKELNDKNVTEITYHFDELFSRPSDPDATFPDGEQNIDFDIEDKITGLSYDQLHGSIPVKDDQDIYDLLSGFTPVTVNTLSGDIHGRYSYPISSYLDGLDYPFPTILTMNGEDKFVSGGTAHVHYGDWPQSGLQRKDNAPVVVDLFANYHPPAAGDTTGKSYQDVLVRVGDMLVQNGVTNGTFECVSDNETICTVVGYAPNDMQADERDTGFENAIEALNQYLRISAVGQGTATVTVTFTPDGGGSPVTLDISVNVTAEMQLSPLNVADLTTAGGTGGAGGAAAVSNVVTLFSGHDDDLLDLYAYDASGTPIDPDLMSRLTLTSEACNFDAQYINSAEQTDTYTYTDTNDQPRSAAMTLKLSSGETTPEDRSTSLTVDYSFQLGGAPFHESASVICQVHKLDIATKDLILKLDALIQPLVFDPGTMLTFALDKDPADPTSTGTPITPEAFNITQAMGASGKVVDITTAQADGFGSAVITPLDVGEEMISINFTFYYGLCRHETVAYPTAYVYAAGGAALTLTSDSMQPGSTLIALSSTGGPATVSISNHVGADWKLEWSVNPGAEDYLDVKPADDLMSATVTVKQATANPNDILQVFVTATVPPFKEGDPEITLTGTAEFQIKNPDPPAPGGDPGASEGPGLEDPAPTDTPLPEGDPGLEGPGMDGPGIEDPTGSPDPSGSPVPVEPSGSPTPGDGPSESPPFDPGVTSPADSPEPVEPSEPAAGSPTPGDGPSESPPFDPGATSPADSPAPVEPSEPAAGSPEPGGGPSESPPFEPGASPADSPAPAEPSNTTAPSASPEAVG